LAIVVLIFLVGQSAGLVYFVNKTRGLSQKNQELEAEYKDYITTARELKTIKADRENILIQTKGLLVDRAKVEELEEALQKAKTEASAAEKELGQVKGQNLSLTEERNKLQASQDQLTAAQAKLTDERDKLKIDYGRSATKARIKELEKKNSDLQRDLKSEVADLQRDLKSKAAEAREREKELEARVKQLTQENSRLPKEEQEKELEARVKQLSQENFLLAGEKNKLAGEKNKLAGEKNKWAAVRDLLAGQLKDYKKNYAMALKKNKAMESKIRETPAKFAEIARQNKVLLRQTSEMHYNLGVFYSKNKDYDRAVAEFEQCVAINPNDASAHFNLGYIYSEYLVNRERAMDHFRHYLRLAKSDDPDVDWVKRYILTWETYSGKMPMQ
jgi:tetratricopeptide (TPR) repeat protein